MSHAVAHFICFSPGKARAVCLWVGEYDRQGYDVDTTGPLATSETFLPFRISVQVPRTREGWPPDLARFARLATRREIILQACSMGFAPSDVIDADDILPDEELDALPDLKSAMRTFKRMERLLRLLGDAPSWQPRRDLVTVGDLQLVSHGADFLVLKSPDGTLRPLFLEDIAGLTVGWPVARMRIRWKQKPEDVGGYCWLRQPIVGRTAATERRGPHLPSRRLLGLDCEAQRI